MGESKNSKSATSADISQLNQRIKDLEDQLAKKEALIVSKNESLISAAKFASLGKMAGEIAHEVNNPLAIITGRVEHLDLLVNIEELDVESIKKITGHIKKTVDRIIKIIRGLRAFAKGGQSEAFQTFTTQSLITEVFGLCQEKFKNAGIPLSASFSDESLRIVGAKIRLSQVILNFINNAFEAIQDSPTPWVKVHCYEDESWNIIEIKDSGKGIDKEIADKILEPFFTTKATSSGTGLGLSISQSIIQEHHGSISLDGNSSNTTFVIKIKKQ